MATMVSKVYDALLEARAGEEKARRAALVLANCDNRFSRVESELIALRAEMQAGFTRLDARIDTVESSLGNVRSNLQTGLGNVRSRFRGLNNVRAIASIALTVALANLAATVALFAKLFHRLAVLKWKHT